MRARLSEPLSPRARPHLVLLGVQLLAAAAFVVQPMALAGFPLDDAWIHQLVARTFVETGTLGAVPGQFAAGASSLLWPLLLALNHAAVPVSEPAFSAAVNVLFYVASGQLLLLLLLRDGVSELLATAAAGLGAISGNHLWFAFSGMEASLLVVLSLGVVEAWTRPGSSAKSALLTGVLLAGAFLTRPEAAALGGLIVASTRWAGRPWSHALRALVPLIVAVAIYVVLKPAGPSTLAGRRWMWLSLQQGADYSVLLESFYQTWAERLARYVLGIEVPELFWTVSGFTLLGAAVLLLERRRRCGLLVAWCVLHLVTYAVLMPVYGHGGRYQPLTCLLYLPLTLIGLATVTHAVLSRLDPSWDRRKVAVLTSAAALAIPSTVTLLEWPVAQALAVRHVNDTEVRMGQLLAGMPKGARLASFDVGGIGYFSRQPLLDLGALFDPAILAPVAAGQTDSLLEARGIDYVVVPMGHSDVYPDPWNFKYRLGLGSSGKSRLEPLRQFVTPLDVWLPGLKATLHCSPRQVLFAVRR